MATAVANQHCAINNQCKGHFFLVLLSCKANLIFHLLAAVTKEAVLLSGYFMDGAGSTIATVNASSAARCLEACNADLSCRYGVYHRYEPEHGCHLKRSANSVSRRMDTVLVAKSYKKFTKSPNWNMWGEDGETGRPYGDLTTDPHVPCGSPDECQHLCHIHPECNVAVNPGLERRCALRVVSSKDLGAPFPRMDSFIS